MKALEYPFDAEQILKKKKALKKELISALPANPLHTRIAVLGGETTQNICLLLELFLLNQGITSEYYESEFDQWYEDGAFPNAELAAFAPDVIYVCTCVRNISSFPAPADSEAEIAEKQAAVLGRFQTVWQNLEQTYHCPVIQNNFEYPYFRLLGNRDASDLHGRVSFVTRLNEAFYAYARQHANFHICDVNYISSCYGLDRWSDPFYWHMYKYAVAVPAIPYLSFNVANIVKSLYGRNKKALNLDLDNTLWGGIVGDDGPENIEIGQETALAQVYSEFQSYLKLQSQLGVLLTVNSKNEEATALKGLSRPDSILHPDDFASLKANWNPKSSNLQATAQELSLLPESFVFVDDNPAERAIIEAQLPGVPTPEIGTAEQYIRVLDRSGFFEATSLSKDDLKRTEMYRENAARNRLLSSFENYEDYLKSLEMKGEIRPFSPLYMSRIAQLTNKSNQFNLTTKRYTQPEIEAVAADPRHITLYGKLGDRFGDNGVVSVVIGRVDGPALDELHMELWLMSCRVLKRDMEYAMMDQLVQKAQAAGIRKLVGYYYPTAKNAMVKDFYALQGFEKIQEDESGNTVWEYVIPAVYENRQHVIELSGTEEGE